MNFQFLTNSVFKNIDSSDLESINSNYIENILSTYKKIQKPQNLSLQLPKLFISTRELYYYVKKQNMTVKYVGPDVYAFIKFHHNVDYDEYIIKAEQLFTSIVGVGKHSDGRLWLKLLRDYNIIGIGSIDPEICVWEVINTIL